MPRTVINQPNRQHEAELWTAGYQIVAGVDEVGRGAWAGPVVAAAVILPINCRLKGVRDSKQLSRIKRQQLTLDIKAQALTIGIGWGSVSEIDQFGLSWALQQAGWRALASIKPIEMVLLDGKHNYLAPKYEAITIVRGDQCCLNVAAASIVAKEARDRFMVAMHRLYPEFNFDTNVGYGTSLHSSALNKTVTPIHRRSFAPVKMVLGYGA